jgi:outer membrane receptor protein involved in Fe transport
MNYSPTKWLKFDLDYANSAAYFTRPDDDGGRRVPEAIKQVLSASVTVHDLHGFYGSLRLRYFGPRDLISTGAAQSKATLLLNLGLGYQFNKHWSITTDIFNLLDRRDHDIDYFYTSQTSPGTAPQTEDHFHPVEPIQARFALTMKF